MTRNTNDTDAHHDEHFAPLDPELRVLHVALDRDASARRAEPDALFEHRLSVGSIGGLLEGARAAPATVAGRIGGGFAGARRLAAAVAILATAGAAWLAMRPSTATTLVGPIGPIVASNSPGEGHSGRVAGVSADSLADDWIVVATTISDDTGAEIDALFAETVRVESSIRNTDSIFGGSLSMDGGGT